MFIFEPREAAVGCGMMLFGGAPAARLRVAASARPRTRRPSTASSPNCCRTRSCVKANGLIEGLTIGSIILGAAARRQLVGRGSRARLLRSRPAADHHRHRLAARGRDRHADRGIYILAAILNLYIPRTSAPLQPLACTARWAWCATSRLQRAAVERQARADLARHHHAVLGRGRQPAHSSCWPGRGRARLHRPRPAACRAWWPGHGARGVRGIDEDAA